MMELDEEESLRLIELFRQKAADKRQEHQAIVLAQLDDQYKKRHELELRKEEEERKFVEAMATPAQIIAFDERLDSYDTATVQALMDNQHALDMVGKERDAIDASAYRLSDGRMAFKTEDGRRVFDQHGAELGADVVHPDAIPDTAPTWEAKQKNADAQAKLVDERDVLHDYQHRLDDAREAAARTALRPKHWPRWMPS